MYGKADSGVYFGIVYLGVSNTLISYILYVVSLLIFQKLNWFGKVDYLVAQMIDSFSACFGPFSGTTNLFLNSALLVVWVDMLHISEFVAPIINLLISVPLNFIINKFWAFK